MNKLATSLTLAAVIMFDVSGSNIQPIKLDPHFAEQCTSRRNSISAIEHITTPPIVTQVRSMDDSVLVTGSHGNAIIQNATEMGVSTITIAQHTRSISKKVLETIHDLHDGNLPKAIQDIHQIREEFDPELERACSSCIGATGGFFSSIKEAFKSLKQKIFGSKSSDSEAEVASGSSSTELTMTIPAA